MPSLLARTSPDQSPDQPPRNRTEPRRHGMPEPNAYGLPHTEELLALRLSDTQLDGLMSRMRGAGVGERGQQTHNERRRCR
jgi:hypothetical protein